MNNLTGKTIYHYNYYFNDGSADRGADNRFEGKEVQVLLETASELVLDGLGLSLLQKECDYRLSLNSPRVVIDIEDKCWGNSVIFDLYSTVELATEVVKIILLDEIKSKVKFLGVAGLETITNRVNEVVK